MPPTTPPPVALRSWRISFAAFDTRLTLFRRSKTSRETEAHAGRGGEKCSSGRQFPHSLACPVQSCCPVQSTYANLLCCIICDFVTAAVPSCSSLTCGDASPKTRRDTNNSFDLPAKVTIDRHALLSLLARSGTADPSSSFFFGLGRWFPELTSCANLSVHVLWKGRMRVDARRRGIGGFAGPYASACACACALVCVFFPWMWKSSARVMFCVSVGCLWVV